MKDMPSFLKREGPLLIIKKLRAGYVTRNGVIKAVNNVSFGVSHGELLGIVGESGCGKSTLALAIMRLLNPPGFIKNGQVLFKGIDLLKLKKEELRRIRWKHISYIPQSSMNALNPVLNIEKQMMDVILTHKRGISKKELKEKILTSLHRVGLSSEIIKMYPHELSGGMRQRVIIALATVLNPELIIADEPTTALDVVTQKEVLQLLTYIKHKSKSSIILITHDMGIHAEISERLLVMYAGKIVEAGDVVDIFNEPLHPYTQMLISAIPSIKRKKGLLSIPGLPPDLRTLPSGCYFHPRCPHLIHGKCDIKKPKPIRVKQNRIVWCHLYGD